MLKKSPFWLLLSMLAFASSCSDEETETSMPKHIVSVAEKNNEVLLLNTNPSKSQTTEINLTSELGISVQTYFVEKNPDQNILEMIYFESWEYTGNINVAKYNPKSNDFTTENLSTVSHDYLRDIEFSSDYIVLLAEDQTGSGQVDKSLSIYDRSSKAWKEVEFCQNCLNYDSFNPMVIKGNNLYIYTQFGSTGESVISLFNLATLETEHTLVLGANLPQVVLTDDFLDLYIAKTVSRFSLSDLSSVQSITVNYSVPYGLSMVNGAKGVMGIPQSQPSSYSTLPAIVDMSTLKILKQYSISEIRNAENSFSEKMDYSAIPGVGIVNIVPETEFVLWSYSVYLEEYVATPGFVFSDYSGKYYGHAELSATPKYTFLF